MPTFARSTGAAPASYGLTGRCIAGSLRAHSKSFRASRRSRTDRVPITSGALSPESLRSVRAHGRNCTCVCRIRADRRGYWTTRASCGCRGTIPGLSVGSRARYRNASPASRADDGDRIRLLELATPCLTSRPHPQISRVVSARSCDRASSFTGRRPAPDRALGAPRVSSRREDSNLQSRRPKRRALPLGHASKKCFPWEPVIPRHGLLRACGLKVPGKMSSA